MAGPNPNARITRSASRKSNALPSTSVNVNGIQSHLSSSSTSSPSSSQNRPASQTLATSRPGATSGNTAGAQVGGRTMVHPSFEPRRPARGYFFARSGTYHGGRGASGKSREAAVVGDGEKEGEGRGGWRKRSAGEMLHEWWAFYKGEFAFSMLESWEILMLHILFALIVAFLYYAIWHYFPTHVRIISRRARYYLLGTQAAVAPGEEGSWGI